MTTTEIIQELKDNHLDKDAEWGWLENTLTLFTRWLERGDGVAVYENLLMGSGNFGHKQFCSYGSQAAQIPTGDDGPPQRMPDIGKPNWAYHLAAKYRLENAEEVKPFTGIDETIKTRDGALSVFVSSNWFD